MKIFHKGALLFVGLMLPYIAFMLYAADVATRLGGKVPTWIAWTMLSYFLGSIVVISLSGRLFSNKHASGEVQTPDEKAVKVARAIRRTKRLLLLYVLFSPLSLTYVWLSNELPRSVLIPLSFVPILLIVGLWKWLQWLRRLQETPHRPFGQ